MKGRRAATAATVLAVVLAIVGAAACASAPESSETSLAPSPAGGEGGGALYVDAPAPVAPARAVAGDGAALTGPLWAFGLDLLARQAAKTDQDVVVSPLSLSAVLSMTLSGARGETARQMRQALRLDGLDADAANQAWADLIAGCNATERAQVRVADSLWLRDGVSYEPGFLATNGDYFAADALRLPADLSEAPGEINAWVEERTGGRIRDLIGEVPAETVLVLVNTVYAKVGWELFDRAATTDRPFTLAGGSRVQVPTMRGTLHAEVVDTAGYTAVPVATNADLTFWVIVPKGGRTPETVAATLLEKGPDALRAPRTSAQVDLELPRFRVEHAAQGLNDDLASMGMPDAFSPTAADFGGMADADPLFIGSVLQKAMIDVNETGIEAAAGSAVVMAGAAPPARRLTVRADRPFLALLTRASDDATLFMALVRDPR